MRKLSPRAKADFGEIPRPTVKSGWKKKYAIIMICVPCPALFCAGHFLSKGIFTHRQRKEQIMSNKSLNRRNKSTNNLFVFVSVAMLSAVAFVLMLFEFPLITSSYLKMDFGDIPAIIGGIIFGPVYAVVIELVKNILELVIKGMGTQMGFGNLMNFIVGCSFAVPYSIVIRKLYNKSERKGGKVVGIVVASVISAVVTVVLGFFANLGIAPLFFKYFLNINLDFNGAMNAAVAATIFNPIKCAILIAVMVIFVTLALPRIRKAIKI